MSDDDAPEEIVAPQLAEPTAGRLTPTPYSFEFTGEDSLLLHVFAAVACTVSVSWRVHRPTGQAQATREVVAFTGSRLGQSAMLSIGRGYLLNTLVFLSSGGAVFGQVFVRLLVVRGFSGGITRLGTIVQGYVTNNNSLAWPGSPIANSLEGPGWEYWYTGTDPAAGAEIAETVPAGARWELVAAGFHLITDATVATRITRLYLDDGSTTFMFLRSSHDVPASQNEIMWWNRGAALNLANNNQYPNQYLPDGIFLLAGHRIQSDTSSLQAGDNYGPPRLLIREHLEVG